MTRRVAGLVLHPTSLPGSEPIGDLGAAVDRFLDWASDAGQSIWQVLPLGPTGPGNSPYSGISTRAGSPLLLAVPGSGTAPTTPSGPRVDYAAAARRKDTLLRASWDSARGDPRAMDELAAFRAAPSQAEWLDDWTLFASLKRTHGGAPWTQWEPALRGRHPAALEEARRALRDEIDYQAYLQWLFFRQWDRVRQAAGARGIAILGDIPIYVALDSADVWAAPEWFRLDAAFRPTDVAGVPPDYFSATGQLWGNPLYRWDRLEADGFAWWIRRLRAELRKFDLVRLDHFRGFASYWAVPAGAKTAIEGRWEPGPGERFFDAARAALGGLPFIAEDLGIVGDDVRALLHATGLPGMRVMQFGFDSPDSLHHPARYPEHCVAYTGTHDNDTTRGWFEKAPAWERARALETVGGDGGDIAWRMILALYRSAAERAIVPVQDVLGLGTEARMNTPSVAEGNWEFRLGEGALTPELAARLRAGAHASGRTGS
ncbi:MAG TPA: 4-alpha-glucanotransferase [Candidatus Binatia bacterium]|nr:4-alpha-glucanotransferase [Candidatus Binatia bacterium]